MRQIIIYENKANTSRENRWFEQGGGKPLWLKQLETGNDFVPLCVCVFVCVNLIYMHTDWQTDIKQPFKGVCGFQSHWLTQTDLQYRILHRYETQAEELASCFSFVQSSEKKLKKTFARTEVAQSSETQSYENRPLLYWGQQ